MKILSDEELKRIYLIAVHMELDNDFKHLLQLEMKRRGMSPPEISDRADRMKEGTAVYAI